MKNRKKPGAKQTIFDRVEVIEEVNGSLVRKIYYPKCNKCGIQKKNIKLTYCRGCCARRRVKSRRVLEEGKFEDNGMKLEMIQWVNKIERRGGLASIEDIFVNLITYYNEFCSRKGIDDFSVKNQIEHMWKSIRNKAKQFELNAIR